MAGSSPFLRAAPAAEKPPLPPGLPEGVYDTATLQTLPGKKPLIKPSYRPPNYETPLSHFALEFTPNDSFFVRYHLSSIPEEIDTAGWKLTVEDPSSAVDVIGIDIGKNSFQSLVWIDAVPSYCVKSGREARSKHGWPRCRLA